MSSHLVACLALHQHKQDKAVGISWLSAKTTGLLWYYNHIHQKQLADLMTAAYLNGIIQQSVSEIKMLVARSEKAKDKKKILKRVMELEIIVKAANKKLDDITNGNQEAK